jgi:hypothetical protein
VADTTPKTDFSTIFKELVLAFGNWNSGSGEPTERWEKAEPEIDGVSFYRPTNPFQQFFLPSDMYGRPAKAEKPTETVAKTKPKDNYNWWARYWEN